MSSFELNDPVSVQRESGGPPLEGIVAALVDDDLVGVRLTGPSVGLGDHNGTTADGTTHFTCPTKCGIVVNAQQCTKRNLSRLEQLRLRRELNTGSGISATTTSTATTSTTPAAKETKAPSTSNTPPRTSAAAAASKTTATKTSPKARSALTPPRASKLQPPATSSNKTTTTTTPTGGSPSKTAARNRIEEIKQRRLALQERKKTETPAKSSVKKSSPSQQSPSPTKTAASAKQQQQAQEERNKLQAELQDYQQKYQAKEQETATLQSQLEQAQQTIKDLQQKQQQPPVPDTVQKQQQELEQTNAQLETLREQHRQLQTTLEASQSKLQQSQKTQDDLRVQLQQAQQQQATETTPATAPEPSTAHYKERAKLQAQVEALKRKLDQAAAEKLDLEQNMEELTLDKEQLLEEKELWQDEKEELKLSVETAQLQVDELQMELEDAQMAAERAVVTTAAAATSDDDNNDAATTMDAHDKAQALALQNARLREALLRLREQASVEKLELGRQLRAAEKDAQVGQELSQKVDTLETLNATLQDQVNDLKDMLDQSSAFESMVEDLSDRVLALEEDNGLLQTTIREMEEAAELTAEMEEVQNDELKALGQDLEGRDTIIRNLEEAIKMQRKREEDYRRTVGNYRTTVETLRLEKQALLELQQGGEGEKNSLIVSSQKALAKAAQLVADAAAMRKREALAVMDKIDHQIYRHLSTRLESLLPQPAVGVEVAAMKGELLASKVVSKAAQSLQAIAKSFGGSIRPPIPAEDAPETGNLDLSDEVRAEVEAMFHQTEFAHDIAGVSSNLLRFLVAGQWPDLLTPEASTELGALLGHSLSELDSGLGQVLLSIKEEGNLTPEQSNIERLRQSSRNTLEQLETDMAREDGPLIPNDWVPPGLELLKDSSVAKFSCMGAAAALSLAVHNASVPVAWGDLYNKVEQCSSQASAICLRLANLDVQNTKLIQELGELSSTVKNNASTLVQEVKTVIQTDNGDLTSCVSAVDTMLRSLAKLSAMFRSANLQPTEDNSYHAFSPETEDTWARLSGITRTIRAIDGDAEDVNYLFRSREVEHRLTTAVENEPKLEAAQGKIVTLEKNVAARSKEISMQNARLSELERMLAKSDVLNTGRSIPVDFKSSKEYNMLMEENRVLLEAMDVLQRQVDEYENEIRVLKDFKAPKRGVPGGRGSRRALTSVNDLASPKAGGQEDNAATGISLEATLFRPALQQALRESWKWKALATSSTLSRLTPLPGPFPQETGRQDDLHQLTCALSDVRMKKASVKLVDLTNSQKTPRQQLQESRSSCLEASRKLETLAVRFRGRMTT